MKNWDVIGQLFLRWRTREAEKFVQGRLLDIGCGDNHLVRRVGSGIGIDTNPRDNVDMCCSALALPFERASFDTVTMVASLNHIVGREEALQEANRVLRHGGRIVVTMPPPFLSKVWHFLRGLTNSWKHWRSTGHEEVFGMGIKEMVRLLKDASFNIVDGKMFAWGMNRVFVGEK